LQYFIAALRLPNVLFSGVVVMNKMLVLSLCYFIGTLSVAENLHARSPRPSEQAGFVFPAEIDQEERPKRAPSPMKKRRPRSLRPTAASVFTGDAFSGAQTAAVDAGASVTDSAIQSLSDLLHAAAAGAPGDESESFAPLAQVYKPKKKPAAQPVFLRPADLVEASAGRKKQDLSALELHQPRSFVDALTATLAAASVAEPLAHSMGATGGTGDDSSSISSTETTKADQGKQSAVGRATRAQCQAAREWVQANRFLIAAGCGGLAAVGVAVYLANFGYSIEEIRTLISNSQAVSALQEVFASLPELPSVAEVVDYAGASFAMVQTTTLETLSALQTSTCERFSAAHASTVETLTVAQQNTVTFVTGMVDAIRTQLGL
jgi:hypothetical protein